MAAARTKQLENKIARYERIMNECPQCKTALALDDIEGARTPAIAPPSDALSRQDTPEASSTASTFPSEKPTPVTRQGLSTRLSKQATPTPQTMSSPPVIDVVSPSSSQPASSDRSREISPDQSKNTARVSTGNSKPAGVEAIPSSSIHSINLRPTTLRPSTNPIYKDALPTKAKRQSTKGPKLGNSGSNKGRPRSDPDKQPRWVVSADKMLGEVPLGWVWNERLSQLDKSMLAAVAIDTSTVSDKIMNEADETQDKDHLLRLVRSFAHRHSDKRLNFQHFLLVCLCNVLSAQNIPSGPITETLQICISDTSELNINKYLKGAQWANKILDQLFFSGWRYRAIDLLVIWDRSIAMYGSLASSPSVREYFISHLTRPEYCIDVQELPNRIHDTIPWIVKKEFGDEVSYESICKVLGYNDDYILETKNLHSSAPPSPVFHRRHSSEDGDFASTFHTATQSATGGSSLQQLTSGDRTPSSHSLSASHLQEQSHLHRQLHQDEKPDDAAGTGLQVSKTVAPQTTKRVVPDRSTRSLGHPDATNLPRKPYEDPSLVERPVPTSLAEIGASNPQPLASAGKKPSKHAVFKEPFLEESSRLSRRPLNDDSRDDAAGRDPPTRQSAASQRKRNTDPDGSAKPPGDSDVARPRRKPSETPSFAADMQSAKRPLPESPTSASQSIKATKWRPPKVDTSSSEEPATPSRSGKQGSSNPKRRA